MPAVGRTPTERDYLSIKEVLDVLVEEFPDVTISKIRFLESRGLIHPERTPSGYRKFFKGDVDRLRWILRQQREHFLPLKVIKGRLDREQGGTSEPSLFDADLDGDELDHELPNRASTSRASESWTGEPFSAEHPPAIAAPALPRIVDTVEDPDGESPEAIGTIPSPSRASKRPLSDDPAAAAVAPTPVEGTSSTVVEVVTTPSQPTPPVSKSTPSASVSSGGASLSASELCGATGSAPGLVESLEEFGLISARVIAGVRSYDEDALVIARLASTFSRFGLEPRHLAILRRAADRQAELYAQAIAPLLRQRNPESKAQAQSQLETLLDAGATLQAAFVKASVHRQIGL